MHKTLAHFCISHLHAKSAYVGQRMENKVFWKGFRVSESIFFIEVLMELRIHIFLQLLPAKCLWPQQKISKNGLRVRSSMMETIKRELWKALLKSPKTPESCSMQDVATCQSMTLKLRQRLLDDFFYFSIVPY